MRPRDRTAVPLGGETASHWDERTTDAINVNTKDNGQTSARATRTAPPVWAVGYPPSGHRRRWLLIVKTCTACRGSHHHYTGATRCATPARLRSRKLLPQAAAEAGGRVMDTSTLPSFDVQDEPWEDVSHDLNQFTGDLEARDLKQFVPANDRHRSLTVVREISDPDILGESYRWMDKIHADAATTTPCDRMQAAVERHADGSRQGQRGAFGRSYTSTQRATPASPRHSTTWNKSGRRTPGTSVDSSKALTARPSPARQRPATSAAAASAPLRSTTPTATSPRSEN